MKKILIISILVILIIVGNLMINYFSVNQKDEKNVVLTTDNIRNNPSIQNTEYGISLPMGEDIVDELKNQICLEYWNHENEIFKKHYDEKCMVSFYYDEREYEQDSHAYDILCVIKFPTEKSYSCYRMVCAQRGFINCLVEEEFSTDITKSLENLKEDLGVDFYYIGDYEFSINESDIYSFDINDMDICQDEQILKDINSVVQDTMKSYFGEGTYKVYIPYFLKGDLTVNVIIFNGVDYQKGTVKILYSGKKLDEYGGVVFDRMRKGIGDEMYARFSLTKDEYNELISKTY